MRNAGAMGVEAAGLQQEQQARHLAKTAFHRVVDRAQCRQIGGDAFVMVADGYEMIRPRFRRRVPRRAVGIVDGEGSRHGRSGPGSPATFISMVMTLE